MTASALLLTWLLTYRVDVDGSRWMTWEVCRQECVTHGCAPEWERSMVFTNPDLGICDCLCPVPAPRAST